MWETISVLINKLPAWYIMFCLPFGGFFWYWRWHRKSRAATFDAILMVSGKVDKILLDQAAMGLYIQDLPVVERLLYGLKYINGGGNGHVKKYFESLSSENPDEARAAEFVYEHISNKAKGVSHV